MEAPTNEEMKLANNPENLHSNREISAVAKGNEIWLASTLDPINYFVSLTHEIGHNIGGSLSFKTGEVMTPDEVKKCTPVINNDDAVFVGDLLTFSAGEKTTYDTLQSVGTQLLGIYTKGRFNPDSVIIHNNVDQDEITQLVQQAGELSTGFVRENGEFVHKSNAKGRNLEIPAYTCEKACKTLLENMMKPYFPDFSIKTAFKGDPKSKSSHQRAYDIAERAYERTGWILPSSKDLK